jgi:hypothetical protein
MFLKFFEDLLLILIALGVITQIIIPAIRGSRSFPLFTREHKLQHELSEVHQAQIERNLEAAIKKEKEKLNG